VRENLAVCAVIGRRAASRGDRIPNSPTWPASFLTPAVRTAAPPGRGQVAPERAAPAIRTKFERSRNLSYCNSCHHPGRGLISRPGRRIYAN